MENKEVQNKTYGILLLNKIGKKKKKKKNAIVVILSRPLNNKFN